MKFVIDANVLIDMKHYYPSVFPGFWKRIEKLKEEGNLISVKEVLNEVMGRDDFISKWCDKNKEIFEEIDEKEGELVSDILSKHEELIRHKSFLEGKPVADPFLIAKAKSKGLVLITNETFVKNAHKIPNICNEYDVKYVNLEEFMNTLNWTF